MSDAGSNPVSPRDRKKKKKKKRITILNKRGTKKETETSLAGSGSDIVIPRISDAQKEKLFQSKIDAILDANTTYKLKTMRAHKQIYELEEKFRYLMMVKEDLDDNGKEKTGKTFSPKPFDESEFGMEGFSIPLELSELDSVEAAQEMYESLLLEYIEHQSILDQMIGAKEEKVQKIEQELLEAGWKPQQRRTHRSKTLSVKISETINESRTGDTGKTLSKTVSRQFKKLTMLPSKSAKAYDTESPRLPDGPTVSESICSNKDMLDKKKASITDGVKPEDFMIMSVIGQGAFGKVYLVVKKDTGQLMAMKVMQKSSILEDGEDSIRHVVHELEFMRDMSHHPFIVSLYHAFQTDFSVSLVMEWIGGGTLFDWLVKRDNPFSENDARFYAAQVLLALQAMHSNNIVYRDLKLENILLDEDGYIRLSDFGLSARAKRGERIHSFSGTATYLAPEIINDTGENGHTHTVDLWCFGVMLFIMLTQEPPFWAEHYPDLFQLIQTSEIPFKFYKHLSKNAVSVLDALLTKDPEKRLGCGPRGIAEVQDHPFFQSVDWKLLLAKKISPPLKPDLNKGKAADPEESFEEESGSADVPVDLFKGFSFVWNPNQARESFLSEDIDVLRSESSVSQKPKKSKNRVVVNFFLWAKEIQGLPGTSVNKPVSIRWKHESKKYCTLIGPSDDPNEITDETSAVLCDDSRSVVFGGAMDNACIACDYLMVQDRKTLAFESRVITFQLMSTLDEKKRKKKCLGKLSIDLRDYSFHKLEKTLVFSFGDSGATLVLSIFCCWKSFNGDLVDNYENKELKGSERKEEPAEDTDSSPPTPNSKEKESNKKTKKKRKKKNKTPRKTKKNDAESPTSDKIEEEGGESEDKESEVMKEEMAEEVQEAPSSTTKNEIQVIPTTEALSTSTEVIRFDIPEIPDSSEEIVDTDDEDGDDEDDF